VTWFNQGMPEWSPFLVGGLTWIYGSDPPTTCPSCSFPWDLPFAAAVDLVSTSPGRIERTLSGRDATVRPVDGTWNAGAYVWHLADLARCWSERWVQVAHEPGSPLVGFDPDDLAAARNYPELPVAPGLWAVRHAVDTLVELTAAVAPEAHFQHGDWGTGTIADGMRWLAHEFHHHEQDMDARAVQPQRTDRAPLAGSTGMET